MKIEPKHSNTRIFSMQWANHFESVDFSRFCLCLCSTSCFENQGSVYLAASDVIPCHSCPSWLCPNAPASPAAHFPPILLNHCTQLQVGMVTSTPELAPWVSMEKHGKTMEIPRILENLIHCCRCKMLQVPIVLFFSWGHQISNWKLITEQRMRTDPVPSICETMVSQGNKMIPFKHYGENT